MTVKSVENTTFEEAHAFFRHFLDENGETAPILWTFKEDALSRKTDRYDRKFWLRLPLPNENNRYAKVSYKLAQKARYGVALTAYARCSEGLCCSVIVPADDEDAQFMLMGPNAVKYSLVQDMTSPVEVKSRIKWRLMLLLSWAFSPGNFLVYLQSRKHLQSRQVSNTD